MLDDLPVSAAEHLSVAAVGSADEANQQPLRHRVYEKEDGARRGLGPLDVVHFGVKVWVRHLLRVLWVGRCTVAGGGEGGGGGEGRGLGDDTGFKGRSEVRRCGVL